jgi:transcriptional regulator with XRE-family HTH domain
MKGSELKEILRKEGVVLMQLAEDLGMSQQNLSAAFTRDDVKSGLIEKIANTLGKPVGYFYGEAERAASYEKFSTDFIGSTDKLLDLLKVKDEQLLESMKQTSTAQDQMTEVLAQMREVINSIKPQESPLSMQIIQPTSSPVTQASGYTRVTTRGKRKGPLTSSIAKKLTDKPKF